jgi:hypothetical protein
MVSTFVVIVWLCTLPSDDVVDVIKDDIWPDPLTLLSQRSLTLL